MDEEIKPTHETYRQKKGDVKTTYQYLAGIFGLHNSVKIAKVITTKLSNLFSN